jgi:hypothetical protein
METILWAPTTPHKTLEWPCSSYWAPSRNPGKAQHESWWVAHNIIYITDISAIHSGFSPFLIPILKGLSLPQLKEHP